VLPTSPSIVAPPSVSVVSFNGTIASTTPAAHPSSITHNKYPSHHYGHGAKEQANEHYQRMSDQKEQAMEIRKNGTVSPSAEIFKSAYVDGIGWASQVCIRDWSLLLQAAEKGLTYIYTFL